MAFRFDKSRTLVRSLMATLLVVALLIPACMTIACLSMPMADGPMHGMEVLDCPATGLTHDLLVSANVASSMTSLLTMAFAVAAIIAVLSSPQASASMAWTLANRTPSPPHPLEPRGERFLI